MDGARQSTTWEDMNLGDRHVTMRRTITEADLVSFVTGTGLFEVLFMDAPYVEHETPYGGRLVPAALTYSFAEGLLVQSSGIHLSGLAFLGMELKTIGPVLVGDTINVEQVVTQVRPSRTPGRGVVTTTNTVFRQDGEPVLEYKPVRLVKGRDYLTATETGGQRR